LFSGEANGSVNWKTDFVLAGEEAVQSWKRRNSSA
jgi:hypothetical protein